MPDLGAEALQDATDEPVVARAGQGGVTGDDDPPLIGGGDAQGRGRRVEVDRELGLAGGQRALPRGADGVGVVGREPDRGIGEQPVTGGRTRDEPPLVRLPADVRSEPIPDRRCHRSGR